MPNPQISNLRAPVNAPRPAKRPFPHWAGGALVRANCGHLIEITEITEAEEARA